MAKIKPKKIPFRKWSFVDKLGIEDEHWYIRLDGGDFHVDDGDATFDQDVSVGGDVAITGGVQVLDTDGIVFAPSSGSNSHVKVASTGDLEIYSAGGDLDIPVWLRM